MTRQSAQPDPGSGDFFAKLPLMGKAMDTFDTARYRPAPGDCHHFGIRWRHRGITFRIRYSFHQICHEFDPTFLL